MSTSGAIEGTKSPLTTKGDVWGYSTTDARLPVGSDGQVMTARSSATLGVDWETVAAGFVNPMVHGGAMIYGSFGSSLSDGHYLSSTDESGGGLPGSNLWDGNDATTWSAARNPGYPGAASFGDVYNSCDLGTPTAIGTVRLLQDSVASGRGASDWAIQGSANATTWTTVYENAASAGGDETHSFTAQTFRYWRLTYQGTHPTDRWHAQTLSLFAGNGSPLELQAGTAGQFLQTEGSGAAPAWVFVPGQLLAVVSYNPGSIATYTITSNGTLVDVDATNLITPSITVPASGKLLVHLSAVAKQNSATIGDLWFAVSVAGTDYDPTGTNAFGSGVVAYGERVATWHYVTGLTAGASVTCKWRAAVDTATSINVYAGGPTISASGVGPAKMLVYAA